MLATLPLLEETDFPPLKRDKLQTLQVNLGYRCNQQCLHCHVNAGPRRPETMSRETIEDILHFLRRQPEVRTLDLTGGAPELNPHFREFVECARRLGVHVLDRCNLTVIFEPGQETLPEFLAEQGVEIIASLPCYLSDNVDRQRGKGVFDKSISALRRLNDLGYGHAGSGLVLNLVYNPQGPTLPPPQPQLEQNYRRFLSERFAITFNRLYTLTNMPIQRFGSMLISKGQFNAYMALLRTSFARENLAHVMCRTLLSVDWQGYLYDCDFNQMLGLPLRHRAKARTHISEICGENLQGKYIVVRDHCYGCTAGQGSSCGGALS